MTMKLDVFDDSLAEEAKNMVESSWTLLWRWKLIFKLVLEDSEDWLVEVALSLWLAMATHHSWNDVDRSVGCGVADAKSNWCRFEFVCHSSFGQCLDIYWAFAEFGIVDWCMCCIRYFKICNMWLQWAWIKQCHVRIIELNSVAWVEIIVACRSSRN